MAVDSATYAPLQYLAGDADIRTKIVTIPANQASIPALTPLKRDSNYKCVPATNIADEIVGVLVPGPGSDDTGLIGTTLSASDQTASVYTHADLWGDKINFASVTTPASLTVFSKNAMFDQSGITLRWDTDASGA